MEVCPEVRLEPTPHGSAQNPERRFSGWKGEGKERGWMQGLSILGKRSEYFGVGVAIGIGIESSSFIMDRPIDPDTDSDPDSAERREN